MVEIQLAGLIKVLHSEIKGENMYIFFYTYVQIEQSQEQDSYKNLSLSNLCIVGMTFIKMTNSAIIKLHESIKTR